MDSHVGIKSAGVLEENENIMKYSKVSIGRFLERPNRFIARVELDGEMLVCHVKNTGRCRELLIPGAQVALAKAENPARKTAYDLIAAYKGRWINMDSQAPNQVFAEWARKAGFPPGLTELRPEVKWGASRFDFAFSSGNRRGLIEIKGVTLEENAVARFPDAPTQRGARHLRELAQAAATGLETWAVFVVQMAGMRYVTPNRRTDPDFARALEEAAAAGVRILALECRVAPDTLEITGEIPVQIYEGASESWDGRNIRK